MEKGGRRYLEQQNSIIQAIQAAPPPAYMSTKIIAIDGPGGAGKSSFAGLLSTHLDHAPILHTDDFASWEHPLDWWPRLLEQVLQPLARNQSARYQRYDWNLRQLAEWHDIQPVPYLILEGVSSARAAFQPYLTFSIWIETPREERLRRGLARDGEDALAQWQDWMQHEDAYIEREHPERRANLVISGTTSAF
jgi:uridine kinase